MLCQYQVGRLRDDFLDPWCSLTSMYSTVPHPGRADPRAGGRQPSKTGDHAWADGWRNVRGNAQQQLRRGSSSMCYSVVSWYYGAVLQLGRCNSSACLRLRSIATRSESMACNGRAGGWPRSSSYSDSHARNVQEMPGRASSWSFQVQLHPCSPPARLTQVPAIGAQLLARTTRPLSRFWRATAEWHIRKDWEHTKPKSMCLGNGIASRATPEHGAHNNFPRSPFYSRCCVVLFCSCPPPCVESRQPPEYD
jgi:hypothetical protein